MTHRRLSSAEKGKGLELSFHQPPRAARVRAPLPNNTELLRKHSLTVIGRVTNKTTQKVWSVIPFFTEHWKTEFKPVGADLGNGMFQFQFETEADLLSVLEQRPYHYARWMIILQRWEPTVSPSFPSLIPFWIKVQGLPVHLWTEPIIKCIGENIGIYEKAEITLLTARMRVHVDGLLPLMKNSVVEFPNGDEVSTSLVYERLDKHCTKCLRLDHDVKECLVARVKAKALKANLEEKQRRQELESGQVSESGRGISIDSVHDSLSHRNRGNRLNSTFHFSASNIRKESDYRPAGGSRDQTQHRAYKSQHNTWQERSSLRRSQQTRERSRHEMERAPRPPRDHTGFHRNHAPPRRSIYREIQRKHHDTNDVESAKSKGILVAGKSIEEHHGNTLTASDQGLIPPEILNVARGDVRDALRNYTKCSDPTEREAREEIMRQAEEKGEVEASAIQVARASLLAQEGELARQSPSPTPERIPASQRPSLPGQKLPLRSGEKDLDHNSNSIERIPAALRLGSHVTSSEIHDRIPAALRLGPVLVDDHTSNQEDVVTVKRKLGRPPGRRKVQDSPSTSKANARRRTIQKIKPPACRKKLSIEESRGCKKINQRKLKGETSKPATSEGMEHSSDNIPLSRMIPKPSRKRADFRIPSAPLP